MQGLMILAGFFCGTLVVSAIVGVLVYNRLVLLRHRYQNGFAQVDVQLQRRYDLIPNLVETAKGYLTHERETLTAVMHARNQAAAAQKQAAQQPGQPQAMDLLQRAEQALSSGLGRFYAVMENYPDLKANATMARVMEELSSTENRVAFARQAYNDFVMRYNADRERIPHVLFAYLFGFKPAHLLQLETPEARQAPKVSFS